MAINPRARRRQGGVAPAGLRRVGEPAATTDTLTIERLDAPEAEAPGNSVTVTATVSCQALQFTNCEAAVRFTMGDQVVRVPQSGNRDIAEAASDKFQATFNMPNSSTSVVVEALEQGSLGRWNVEDSAEMPIESITQREKLQRSVISFVPWTVGGGAVGAGIASFRDQPPLAGAAAGVGAGITGKVIADNIGGLPNLGGIIPEFPTTAVLATAGLLAAVVGLFVFTPVGRALNLGSLADSLPSPGR